MTEAVEQNPEEMIPIEEISRRVPVGGTMVFQLILFSQFIKVRDVNNSELWEIRVGSRARMDDGSLSKTYHKKFCLGYYGKHPGTYTVPKIHVVEVEFRGDNAPYPLVVHKKPGYRGPWKFHLLGEEPVRKPVPTKQAALQIDEQPASPSEPVGPVATAKPVAPVKPVVQPKPEQSEKLPVRGDNFTERMVQNFKDKPSVNGIKLLFEAAAREGRVDKGKIVDLDYLDFVREYYPDLMPDLERISIQDLVHLMGQKTLAIDDQEKSKKNSKNPAAIKSNIARMRFERVKLQKLLTHVSGTQGPEINMLIKTEKQLEEEEMKQMLEDHAQQVKERNEVNLSTIDNLLELQGVGPKTANELGSNGYDNFEKIANATTNELAALEGIGQATAKKIIDSAFDLQQKKLEGNPEHAKMAALVDQLSAENGNVPSVYTFSQDCPTCGRANHIMLDGEVTPDTFNVKCGDHRHQFIVPIEKSNEAADQIVQTEQTVPEGRKFFDDPQDEDEETDEICDDCGELCGWVQCQFDCGSTDKDAQFSSAVLHPGCMDQEEYHGPQIDHNNCGPCSDCWEKAKCTGCGMVDGCLCSDAKPAIPSYDQIFAKPALEVNQINKDMLDMVAAGSEHLGSSRKPAGRKFRDSQPGACHAQVFLDTHFDYLPSGWQQQANRRELEARSESDGSYNLGGTSPGTAGHEYFQGSLDWVMEKLQAKFRKFELISYEKKIWSEFNNGEYETSGHYDGLARWGNRLLVLDFKSAGEKWFDKMVENFETNKKAWENYYGQVKAGKIPWDPHDPVLVKHKVGILDFAILDPKHICQLHQYMYKLGLDQGMIVYFSKKDYRVYTVLIEFVPAVMLYNYKWYTKQMEYRREKTIPPTLYPLESYYESYPRGLMFPCRVKSRGVLKYQCKYIDICYKREDVPDFADDDLVPLEVLS